MNASGIRTKSVCLSPRVQLLPGLAPFPMLIRHREFAPPAEVALLPGLFAATLFVGATLLFLVEPHVGKRLLPLVGGTPGVWNACLVFFQAALLAGYLYAHRSIVKLGVRKQAVLHLALLLVVLLAFKIAISQTGSPLPIVASLVPADQDYPIVGVVELLAVAVGVPFFVLCTTAPLLQRWFASTGHPSAKDPYFLYAASNAGSLLGLLAYPFLIEPRFTLDEQQWLWAGGVCVYLAMVLVCAVVVVRRRPDPETADRSTVASDPIAPRRILRWVGLAALPSSLLLGSTAHVSTDLAPVPLLWVVPLALYLVSFILVFARWPDSLHRLIGRLTPMLLVFVVLSLLTAAAEPLGLIAGMHFAALFGICLVCHGELAKDRPHPDQLTAFYLWMSVGGVVGGLFNALVAPVLFQSVGMVEYPLALALAALVRPRTSNSGSPLCLLDGAFLLGLLGLAIVLMKAVPHWIAVPADSDDADALIVRVIRGGLMFGIPAAIAFALVRKPARFAIAIASLLAVGSFDTSQLGETVHMERNFFGVVRVTRSPDGRFLRLVHGTTLHGQQRLDEKGPPRPMTYYHEKGPVGNLFRSLPPERIRKVAVVGLGTGAVAAYAKPHQEWTFFEIDPAVARIANDYFDFLSTCRAKKPCNVVLGDARRKLMLVPDGEFDVIMLDAFSSDSIPVHLLTREAMQLYIQKLAPGGVLAMHVSNNHLDLPPLVNRLAADHTPPLSARYCHDLATDAEKDDGKFASQWMVLARSDADLWSMSRGPTWFPVQSQVHGPIWRDDFANLLWAWKRKEE